jgi:periplasmic copper chaperone A
MRSLLAAMLIALPMCAMADPPTMTVDHAWSRAAMAGREGVVYLTITNSGAPDQLTAISTPVAAMAQLHQTINDNGVMKMRAVKSLEIDQGKSVTLAPSGYHIMLMDLKQALKQGESFPVTLTFAKAGPVTATAMVEKAGATSMAPGDMSQHMSMPMQSGSKQP